MPNNDELKEISTYKVKIRPLMDGNTRNKSGDIHHDIVKIRPLMDGNEYMFCLL